MAGEGSLGSIVRTLQEVGDAADGAVDKMRSARREMEGAAEAARNVERSTSAASASARELDGDIGRVNSSLSEVGGNIERVHGQIRGITADDVNGLGTLDELLRAGAVSLNDLSGALAGAKVQLDGIIESASSFLADRVPEYKNNLGELIGEIARGKQSIEEIGVQLRDLDTAVTDQLADLVEELRAGEISAQRFKSELDQLRERYRSGDLAALLEQLEQLGQRAGAGLEGLLNEGRLDGSL